MNKLIWQQDFLDRQTDLSSWNMRLGNDLLDHEGKPIHPGWGNGEQQYYTGEDKNLYIDEHGLNICAHREVIDMDGRQHVRYTSARIDTKDYMSFCYGKLIVRAKLPIGQGLWPAIWLMPQKDVYGPWPASGEIDIMEARGRLPQQVSGALHYGKDFDDKVIDEFTYDFEQGSINQFRDYALEWDAHVIRWLVDEYCYAERPLQQGMPFDQPFYLILNLAIGGWYDHVPIDDTALPAVMTVSGIWLYES